MPGSAGKLQRVQLTLATGSGKSDSRYQPALGLSQSGELRRPALLLCDRDELCEQAYTELKAAFGGNVRNVKTASDRNAAANACVHVGSDRTLGIDGSGDESFLTEHHGENALSFTMH